MFENYNIFYSSRFGDLERVKYLIGIEGIDVNIREPGYVIKYSLHSQFSVIYCIYFIIYFRVDLHHCIMSQDMED